MKHEARIKNIEEITDIFSIAVNAKTESELSTLQFPYNSEDSDTFKYGQVLRAIPTNPEVANDFVGISFSPSVIQFCIMVATNLNYPEARFAITIANQFLMHFKDYLSVTGYGLIDSSDAPFSKEYLELEQKRVFSYCMAQFIECGVTLPDIFTIMRGITLTQDSSYEIRRILEEGPVAILNSELFSDDEKIHWERCLSATGTVEDWNVFQKYLVEKYKIPFLSREG